MKIINLTLNDLIKGNNRVYFIFILNCFDKNIFLNRMSPILSATLVSCFLIMFFSFLSTKIDQSVKWNWFIVFIPLFFLQTCFFIDNILLTIKNRSISKIKLIKLFTFLISNILLLAFEILLCLKLEYFPSVKLSFVFIPFWLLSVFIIGYLFIKLSQ